MPIKEGHEHVLERLRITVDDLIEQDLGDPQLRPNGVPSKRAGRVWQERAHAPQALSNTGRNTATPLGLQVVDPVLQKRPTAAPWEALRQRAREARRPRELVGVDPGFRGRVVGSSEGRREQAHGTIVPAVSPSSQNLMRF